MEKSSDPVPVLFRLVCSFLKDNFLLEHLTGCMTSRRLEVKKIIEKGCAFSFPLSDAKSFKQINKAIRHVYKLVFFDLSKRVCSYEDCTYLL